MSAPGAANLPVPSKTDDQDDRGPGESAGEYLTLDGNDNQDYSTEDTDDGGMIVTIGDDLEKPRSNADDGFYRNLAEVLPESELQKIATDLLRRIKFDREAREKRDKQYEEGLRRTGLGGDAPGGAEFEGASRVVHPLLTEACIDYESRVIKELWPTGGPVKKMIVGESTKDKDERATRKVEFMNYQLRVQIKEARATMEETLTQTPMGGAGYIKQWQDHRLKRPRWQFVGIDKVIIPPCSADFYSAYRRTHMDTLTAIEFKQRVDAGMYRDLQLPAPSSRPEQTKAQAANDKIEGVDQGAENIDSDRDIYETMSYLEVTEEMVPYLDDVEQAGELNPYLITLDTSTTKVLSIYRDWEQDDDTKEPIDHLFEIPFIPWRGGQPIGFPHIIGGLSAAATGALRALLDAALIANTPGYFVLKGSGISGQNKRPNPTDAVEIESGLETQDIREKVMPFSAKEPSSTLFQLLGFVVEAGKGVVRTSMDESAIDTNANTPVGTQLSRVEEGLTVFSAIHGRVHAAMNRILLGLHRLNRLYLPDTVRVDAEGKEIFIRRADFEGPPDVQPVSDPTIYSDQQRMAQLTAIFQRQMVAPQLYQGREVEEQFLKLIKFPDPDAILVAKTEPTEMNPVNENVALALGRPTVAFPNQDHLAHLQVHLDFGKSPVFGMNPIIRAKFLPAFLQHCVEHMVMLYADITNRMVSKAAGVDAVQLMSKSPQVKQAFDRMLALASQQVVPQTERALAGALPVLQEAFQVLQQLAPKPPMDPAQAAIQAATQETQRKGAADQAKAKNDQIRNAILAERNQIDAQGDQQENATRLTETVMDNRTAEDIASMRLVSGRQPGFSTGESLTGG